METIKEILEIVDIIQIAGEKTVFSLERDASGYTMVIKSRVHGGRITKLQKEDYNVMYSPNAFGGLVVF